MIHEYSDSSNVGIINGSMPSYIGWKSLWEDKGEKLVCVMFTGDWDKDVKDIVENKRKDNEGYHRCCRAYSRHKWEIERKLGTYKEKNKKDKPLIKVVYYHWHEWKVDEIPEGGKAVGGHRNPHKFKWTPEKQKLVDEYNKNEQEHRERQSALNQKIEKECDRVK